MSGALEAARQIVEMVDAKRPRLVTSSVAEIIDRLAVQPAVKELEDLNAILAQNVADSSNRLAAFSLRVEKAESDLAAERKRAEGLVAVIRAGIPKVQFSFDVSQSSTVCYELRHLKLTLERALADYESNAPVPTEETGVRELVRVLSRIMEDLPTKRDWLDPMIEISANTLLSKYKGVK